MTTEKMTRLEALEILAAHDPTINTDAINVWCADLNAYNCGRLIGQWFDLSVFESADELREAFSAFIVAFGLPDSEEWAIHDYDSPSGGVASHFGEHPDFEELLAAQRALEEHGSEWVEAAIDCGIAFADIEDYRMGDYENEEDVGYSVATEHGYIDNEKDTNPLLMYIDYERYGRDILLESNHTTVNGRIYVFSH